MLDGLRVEHLVIGLDAEETKTPLLALTALLMGVVVSILTYSTFEFDEDNAVAAVEEVTVSIVVVAAADGSITFLLALLELFLLAMPFLPLPLVACSNLDLLRADAARLL